nr:immunoglobulin light chain junction region [Macaca mulatta]
DYYCCSYRGGSTWLF